MVAAMDAYWHDHPPVHLLVAAYLDYKPQPRVGTDDAIDEVAEFIPVAAHSAEDFNALLLAHGLPVDG